MAEPVRFVKIRLCKNCKEWLRPGYKEDLCPKCLKEKEESDRDEAHNIL